MERGFLTDLGLSEELVDRILEESGKEAAAKKENKLVLPPMGEASPVIDREAFRRMGYRERCKLFDESPKLYEELRSGVND